MKIHILTIGKPKLEFAVIGFNDYIQRLSHYHDVSVTHLADKYAYDPQKILNASLNGQRIALEITGRQFSSLELAEFLDSSAMSGKVLNFIIGGPEGLPRDVITSSDLLISLGKLTFPHDLAMLILAETLYRASSINAGSKYHK